MGSKFRKQISESFWNQLVSSTAYALKCALAGDIKTHRRWILRSLALTCAAITFRFMILGLMLFLSVETAYLLVTWFSWIINLFFVGDLFAQSGAGLTPILIYLIRT